MPADQLQIKSDTALLTDMSNLVKAFESEGNWAAADKLEQLIRRAETDSNAVYAAFVGLFSAGKSSLLNTLCNTSLATGAIPTTAEATRITLPDEESQVVLLDTPGVDSTDDAHQEATEKALHMADAVVLVMDYQHVEADENLELAQEFAESKKRLAIVVNQIDKHLDFELPFEDFRRGVLTTLEDWDIEFDSLFFTANLDSPYNQLPQLRQWLRQLGDGKSSREDADATGGSQTPAPLLLRAEEMIDEHVDWLYQERWAAKAEVAADKIGFQLESLQEIKEQYEEIGQRAKGVENHLKKASDALEQSHKAVSEQLMRSISSAQIAPYETTEKGKKYIASCRPEFRIGWFRKQEKTQEERQQRLHSFIDDISARTTQFLLWPTQSELRQILQQQDWLYAKTDDDIAAMELVVTEDLCRKLVQEGALVSESYGHQYVADVVSAIKGQCTRQVKRILDEVRETAKEQLEHDLSREHKEWQQLNLMRSALGDMLRLAEEKASAKEQYMAMLFK